MLSTIPQVLIAGIGLFGIFLVFRLDQITSQIFGVGESIFDEIERQRTVGKLKQYEETKLEQKATLQFLSRLKKATHQRNLPKFLKTIDTIVDKVPTPSFKDQVRDNINLKVKQRKTLLNTSIASLVINAVIILSCIAAIPFSTYVSTTCSFYWVITIGVIGSVLGLGLIIGVTIYALTIREPKGSFEVPSEKPKN